MRKELLIVASIMFSLKVGDAQAACTETPNCTELGFTKTVAECKYGSVKCPWNTGLVYCKERRAICQIGWIYYEDGICVAPEVHNPNKVALGVVVYVNPDGIGGLVMSAWPVDKKGNKSNSNILWADDNGSNFKDDNAELPNYKTAESAATDFSSCDNTDKILAYTHTTFPAARAVRLYAPTNETKGKWCLPAAGVLTSIYNNQTAVQAGISKLGGVEFPSCCTWTSSEYSSYNAWEANFSYSYGLDITAKVAGHAVYPVLEF